MHDTETFVWQGLYFNTTELFSIENGNPWKMKGHITGEARGLPVHVSYEVEVDESWNTRMVKVNRLSNNSKVIVLKRGSNNWYDEAGKHLPALDECADIDISLTPSTNTLPIKRLTLPKGSSKEIRVAYLDLLTFEVLPLQQRYTNLGNNFYRYENPSSGFNADIETDENAFVIRCPGVWERIYPANASYNQNKAFSLALISNTHSDELHTADIYYDWLIGSWEVTAFDYFSDGTKIKTEGECIFNWVLEGRAIQDLWIFPKRALRSPGMSRNRNRYGSTLRIYYPDARKWKVFWHNPVSGAYNELTAKRQGKDIVQEGIDSNGNLIRWVFSNIQQDSFHWYGEKSSDGGKHWELNTEFFGVRKK